MRRAQLVLMAGLMLLLALLARSTMQVRGQSEGYKLSQGAIVGGGGTVSNGAYSLTGALGQPVAGQPGLNRGCGYAVDTGVYSGIAADLPVMVMEVDDDFTPATPCWLTSRFPSIQAAIEATPAEGMVLVAAGHYSESVVLTATKTVSITGDIALGGDLLIAAGTFLAPSGVLTVTGTLHQMGGDFQANGGTLRLAGDWNAAGGSFAAQSGTVSLIGGNQAIHGTATFFNLTKETATAATLTWSSGMTQTVAGTLTLRGVEGQPLILRSDQPGSQWRIDPQGARLLAFLDVRDSANVNASLVDARSGSIRDSGNNTGWLFGDMVGPQPLYLPLLRYP